MRLSYKLLNDPAVVKTELLSTRVCDLKLKLAGSMLQSCIDRAIAEVQEFGVELRPYFYLSDAYGCVQNTANIGLGFWDVSEPLREIYRDARGQNRDEVDLVLLLKHEIGHAFCYAHKLYQLSDFRRVFRIRGHFFATYPDHNRFPVDPYSVDHVNPDYDHYAQKHPDDDFAETFATFIDPDAAWRERYRARSGAMRKITFVAQLIAAYGRAAPEVEPGSGVLDLPVERIRKTVAQFLRIGRTRYLRAADGYLDDDLRRIFHNPGRRQRVALARDLLRRYRKFIEFSVNKRVRPHDARAVTDLLDKVRSRLVALGLVYDVDDQDKALAELYGLILHKSFVFHRFGTFRNGQ
ncbi:MAG: hypothetical protein JXR83_23440 [Deltaproteobacteria bacterium]|nr:hypothetical protein [Deltaproteobacteria bacterium]